MRSIYLSFGFQVELAITSQHPGRSFVRLNTHPKQRVRAQGSHKGPSATTRERKRTHAPPKTHLMHMLFAQLRKHMAVISEGGGEGDGRVEM